MKNKGVAFFSIVLLAFILMALIVVTQYFTNKSTKALNIGNLQAVETFRINNGIQELVNLSFDLQSKLKNVSTPSGKTVVKQLTDSLTMLGYNANILTTITAKESHTISATINSLIDSQINLSQNIISTLEKNDALKRKLLIDSLQKLNPGDKVYTHCVALQQLLKNNLQETLTKNYEQAGKLSIYNRILAMFAIIAIVLMATIIINRQWQQLKLIEGLRAAEIAALKSKNAKDEFLANMSHELRTPLTALIGFGNLLHETKLNEEQEEYVDMVRSGGQNLLNIVNDVLDLSKIEAGKLNIAHKPFNIYDLFTKIEKLFSTTIKQKGLRYSYHIDELIPTYVIGDPDRLQQVFVNLIGNAIKFTNEGEIKVSAGIVWMDEEKKYFKLSFTVSDTGTGIPKEKIETIFERFEQLEHGTLRQHGGTGLGLTIVKNLVEKMGGSISVYSQLNEGSEFNFTCLLEKSDKAEDSENVSAVSKLIFENCKALIVEDNKANQMLLKHLFNKHHIEPHISENGADAIEILKTNSFNIVFMDIQMPVLDGYSAIDIARNQLKLSTPVIAMTAYVTETEIERCYNAGFTDYIPKPIDEPQLMEKLSTYLKIKNDNETNGSSDLRFLKDIIGNDPEVVEEVLHEMKLQWNKDKTDLLQASNNGDTKQVGYILHRLRSTFSFLGADHKIYKIVQNSTKPFTNGDSLSAAECDSFIRKIDQEVSASLKN